MGPLAKIPRWALVAGVVVLLAAGGGIAAIALHKSKASRGATSFKFDCAPARVAIASPTTCTVTVSGAAGSKAAAPKGTITLAAPTSGAFTPGASCVLEPSGSSGSCSVTYTPHGRPGTHVLSARYPGTKTLISSQGDASVTITRRATSAIVKCSPEPVSLGATTTCFVTVSDADAGQVTAPRGSVTLSSHPAGTFSPAKGCKLTVKGTTATCTVKFTPTGSSGSHLLAVAYAGDAVHAPSRQSTPVAVSKTPSAVAVSCSPASVAINVASTCTATVSVAARAQAGAKSAVPTGTVKFSGKGHGAFTPAAHCALVASGTSASCHVTYTPSTSTGTRTLTAGYGGDKTHKSAHHKTRVTVTTRTTTTTIKCASSAPSGTTGERTCTVTVTDTSTGTAITPTGTVTFTSTGGGRFSASGKLSATGSCTLAGSGAAPTCTVNFTPGAKAKHDTITASYPGDTTHALSKGTHVATA